MKTFFMSKNTLLYILFLITVTADSCKKQDEFLNALPDISLAVPNTLNDCQLLLQNSTTFNTGDPGIINNTCDDYYVASNYFLLLPVYEQNSLTWVKDMYPNMQLSDWNNPYEQVFTANIVLEALEKISVKSQSDLQQYNELKGYALFFRGRAFFNLLQVFAKAYDSSTATSDPGIPIRLSSDLNIPSVRATVKASYDQVLSDLNAAAGLVPNTPPVISLPGKNAVYGYLARTYLSMRNYTMAYRSADTVLQNNVVLTDYNTLNAPIPISSNTLSEDLFRSSMITYRALLYSSVDSNIYAAYDTNDLRRKVYFFNSRGRIFFRGTYDVQHSNLYDGIATDEMYLVRAECLARSGDAVAAMNDLNTLLRTRYITGTYVDKTAINATDALNQILLERRKELICRGIRWWDIKRLNKESDHATTLVRIVSGTTYTLPPNDSRYALPIPDPEIEISGIQQN